MKVYIVSVQYLYDTESILGVYSNAVSAARHLEALGDPGPSRCYYITDYDLLEDFNGLDGMAPL